MSSHVPDAPKTELGLRVSLCLEQGNHPVDIARSIHEEGVPLAAIRDALNENRVDARLNSSGVLLLGEYRVSPASKLAFAFNYFLHQIFRA